MSILKAGQTIPEFSTIDQDGNTVSSDDLKKDKTVLYFYPQDNTPTCTNQACNIRDNYEKLMAEGYTVYGISPDSARKHQNFIKKFDLPFDLLVDKDHEIADKFGVWAEKETFGRKYMGILRTTFLFGEGGVIKEIISDVVSKDHANQIMG